MLGLGSSLLQGGALRSIVRSGLQLFYKADRTQAPLGEEQVRNNSFDEISSNLVSNPTFNLGSEEIQNRGFNELGSDKIDNGNFETGIDGWNPHVSGDSTVTYNSLLKGIKLKKGASVAVCKTSNEASNTVQGKTYKLTYRVLENNNCTAITVWNGSQYEGSTELNVEANGEDFVYYLKFIGGNSRDLYFENNTANSDITLSNIKLEQVDPNDRWDVSAGWNIEEGKAVCDGTQTGNTSLKQFLSVSSLSAGRTYKLSYTISNYVNGLVNPHIRGAFIGNVSGDGDKVAYIVAGSLTSYAINFYADQDFNAEISNVSVKEVPNWVLSSASVSDNKCTMTSVGGAMVYFYQTGLSLTQNKSYKISFKATRISGDTNLAFSSFTGTNVPNSPTISQSGEYSIDFTPSSNVTNFGLKRFVGNSGAVWEIENFSVKQLDPNNRWTVQNTDTSAHTVEIREGETYINYDHDGGTVGSTGINQSGVFSNTTSKYEIEVELGEVTGQLKVQARGISTTINSSDSNTTKVILLDSYSDEQTHIFIVRLDDDISGSAFVKNVSVREITNSIKDHSRNSNDGILYSGKALALDPDTGALDYVSLKPSNEIGITSAGFTFAIWFKADSTQPNGSDDRIFSSRRNSGSSYFSIGLGDNGHLRVHLRESSTSLPATYVQTNYRDDKWHRVVVSASPTAQYIYVDNELVGTATRTLGSDPSSDAARLGTSPTPGVDNSLKCNLADLQTYDKAWNATDVKYDWENPDKDVFDRVGEAQVLGSEEVVDGGFPTGTTAWTVGPSTNLETEFGDGFVDILKEVGAGSTDAYIYQSILEEGKTYQVTFSGVINQGVLFLGVNDARTVFVAGEYINETFTFTSITGGFNPHLFIIRNPATGTTIDARLTDISVKEITTHASHILPTDCKSLLRLNEGAGDRVYDAAPVLGEDLMESRNGSFELGEELNDLTWVANSDWSINGDTASSNSDGTTLTNDILELGKTYQFKCKLSSYTSGDFRLMLGGTTISYNFSGTDEFTFIGVCTGDTNARVQSLSGIGSLSISSLTIKEIPNWTLRNNTTIVDGVANVVAGGNIGGLTDYWSLESLANVFEPSKTYQIKFKAKQLSLAGSNAGAFQVGNSYGALFDEVITSEFVDYTFIAQASSSNWPKLTIGGRIAGDVFQIDDISVKEIKPAESFAIVGDKNFIHQQPYIPQYAMSSFSKKMLFDGSNDYLACGSDASIDDIFTGGGTFSAWISPKTDGGENLGTIIGKGSVSIRVKEDDNDGVILNLAKGFSTTNADFLTSDEVVLENKMNHIAITYNDSSPSNTPSFYVNGVLTAIDTGNSTTPVGSASTDALSNLIIGNATAGGTRSFDGIIDEVSMFKTILTQDEVLELYNSGSSFDSTGHSKYNLGEEVSNGTFDLGSEEVDNGDFSGGTTSGWTFENLTADISNNTLKLTSTTATNNKAYYDISTEVGKTYQISADVKSGATNSEVGIGAISTTDPYKFQDGANAASFTTLKFVFTATLETTQIRLLNSKQGTWGGLGSIVEFDNISVKEVPNWELRPGWSVNNNTVVYDGTGSIYARIIQTLSTVVGRTYQMTFTLSGLSSTDTVNFGLGRNGAFNTYPQQTYSSNGTYTRIMQAQSVDDDIMVQINQADANCTVSNISVQEYGLSGYWRNNGADQWDDLSINSNHGTVSGSPTEIFLQEVPFFGKDSLGMFMNKPRLGGLNFNGSGYVEIHDTADLDFPAATGVDNVGEFSVGCWVRYKFLDQVSSTANAIYSNGGQVNDSNTFGLFTMSNSEIGFFINNSAISSVSTFSLDEWVHVVATREYGSAGVKLYINGNTTPEATLTNNDTVTNSFNKRIGWDGHAARYLESVVDDVKLYNRALTPAEIKKNYNATKGKHKN